MKTLVPGHKYELENMEGGSQTIQFIHKEPGKPEGTLTTVQNGTTNEEVLAMLADRLTFLNNKMPSHFNEMAIEALGVALTHLKIRTEERKGRGVEGTSQP